MALGSPAVRHLPAGGIRRTHRGLCRVIAAALFLVFLRSPGRPYIAAIMTLWGALASASTWGVRPQMFSLLLASVFLVLLDASERRPRLLWWTAPLMLLWVNLHAGFPIGWPSSHSF